MSSTATLGRSADLRTIRFGEVNLSPMQRDILNLLARGFTGAQAAASLGIPAFGVQNRLQALRAALGAGTVTQAVLAGHRCGFLRRERYPRFELTGGQHELLGWVASGWSNGQIAAALGLAEAGHRLANLYEAMGVRNRPHAAHVGVCTGLLDLDGVAARDA